MKDVVSVDFGDRSDVTLLTCANGDVGGRQPSAHYFQISNIVIRPRGDPGGIFCQRTSLAVCDLRSCAAALSGSGRRANMPTAVAPSVRSTVGNTPSRAPRKPHTSLPAAPPAKTIVKASPISGSPAPLDCNRNGRNVRKPMRVALSITPIVSRRGKPLRSSLVQSGALSCSDRIGVRTALADVTARSDSKMAPAPKSPITPTAVPVQRQEITAIRQAVSQGNAHLPRAAAKL